MGRGRQKAKHTKLARELKSFSPNINYSVLQRELGSAAPADDDLVDKWADYADYHPNDNDADDDDADDDDAVRQERKA